MRRALPVVPEAKLVAAIVDVAHRYGWRVAHFGVARLPDGRPVTPTEYDAAGFPDLVLVHPNAGVWFREVKAGRRPNRPLEPNQARWYADLAAAGANVDVWRTGDFVSAVRALSFGRAVVQAGAIP